MLPLSTDAKFIVATKTPLPDTVGAVTVAVYVPLLLSVTKLIAPAPDACVIVTLSPPIVLLFPLTSFACTMSTCVLAPSAVMDAVPGVKVDCVALALPAVITKLVELALVKFVGIVELAVKV